MTKKTDNRELTSPFAKSKGYHNGYALSIEAVLRFKNSDDRAFAVQVKPADPSAKELRIVVREDDTVLLTLMKWTDIFNLHPGMEPCKFEFPADDQPIVTFGWIGVGVNEKPFVSSITSKPKPKEEPMTDSPELTAALKRSVITATDKSRGEYFSRANAIMERYGIQPDFYNDTSKAALCVDSHDDYGGDSVDQAVRSVLFHCMDKYPDSDATMQDFKSLLINNGATDKDFKTATGYANRKDAYQNGKTASELYRTIEMWLESKKEKPTETPQISTKTDTPAIPIADRVSTPANPPTVEPASDMKNEIVNADIIEEIETPSLPHMPSEIVLFDPQRSLNYVRAASDLIVSMLRDKILVESGKEMKDGKEIEVDGDYGRIAGSKKPALYKSGAEKLCEAFGLRPEFPLLPDSISNWDAPFFYFHYKCELYRISDGKLIATANGSCNSREDKYGWRWVELDKVPFKYRNNLAELETRPNKIWSFKFSVEEAKTDGQYGKPPEYWQMFHSAIENGTAALIQKSTKSGKMMEAWEIDGTTYRVPNPDIYSIVNTIDKMAQKRALVAAVLIGTAASRFFTQDIEELPDFGMVA